MSKKKPSRPTSPSEPNPPEVPHASVLGTASTMTGSVLGLGGLGYFLDRHFDTAPILVLIGCRMGVVVGMYELYKSMFGRSGS